MGTWENIPEEVSHCAASSRGQLPEYNKIILKIILDLISESESGVTSNMKTIFNKKHLEHLRLELVKRVRGVRVENERLGSQQYPAWNLFLHCLSPN